MREGTRTRDTRETAISIRVRIDDGHGCSELATGYRFFDHMLAAFAFHGGLGIAGYARSLDGIEHHLIEDVAIVLGGALADALGEKSGIERFGTAYVPMDDALVRAVVDLSGRPYARIDLPVARERVEDLDVELVGHFFRSLAQALGATLHLDRIDGSDGHHLIEAAFKATARALRAAWHPAATQAPASTKGMLA
jgi:imidazoleglycerol-phosphate dehydratase